MGIDRVVSLLGKFGKAASRCKGDDEIIYKISEAFTDGSGKAIKIFDGKGLPTLPEDITGITKGLTHPKVKMSVISKQKGQGILGFQVADGNRIITRTAYNIDTRGTNPIIQRRVSLFDNNKCVSSTNTVFDTNVKLNPKYTNIKTDGKTFLSLADEVGNRAYSESMYIDRTAEVVSSEIKALMPKELLPATPARFNKGAAEMRQFFANKGIRIYDITECENVIKQIGRMKTKPTEESVRGAVDKLAKAMGFESDVIVCEIRESLPNAAAVFDQMSGKLLINKEFIDKATNAEIAILLSHELQHLGDFVKLSKAIGITKYEKLLSKLPHDEGEIFNKAFYEQAGQYMDLTNFKAKPFVDELKSNIKLANSGFTDNYLELHKNYAYNFSHCENRARATENWAINTIAGKQGRESIQTTAEQLSKYGRSPAGFYTEYLPEIETKLAPYEITQRNEIYNKAYKEAEQYYLQKCAKGDDEFAELLEKFNKEQPLDYGRFNELIKQYYGTFENFECRILSKVVSML